MNDFSRRLACSLLSAPFFWGACNKSDAPAPAPSASAAPKSSAAASESAVAPVAEGIVRTPREIEKVVNPKREQPYSGPTGTVAGTVVITGDKAPDQEDSDKIPGDCLSAREMYRHRFREGMLRSAADVFVAVTGYSGYVPAKEDSRLVSAKGCAFDTRTVGVTYGQDVEVVSKDTRAYVPELLGARSPAQLVATPGGQPVKLYPEKTGRYVLLDSMRTFAKAEVLVVAYATFDVTGLDGKFQIEGVPAGKAKLDALLPSVMLNAHQEITVLAGKTINVDLELSFDNAQFQKGMAQAAKRPGKSKKD